MHLNILQLNYFLGITKKTPVETTKLAECVGDARSLLRKILSRSRKHMLNSRKTQSRDGEAPFGFHMSDKILDECHNTFTACFHAFYPTPSLKWMCLVDLLMLLEPVRIALYYDFLLWNYFYLLWCIVLFYLIYRIESV